MKSILSLLFLATLAVYAAASPAPARPIPGTIPRPPPRPPIRVRRASNFPKPSMPRPRPVPLPRPVPRPKPIPPIRVRRDAVVPQLPQSLQPHQLPQKPPLDVKVIQPSHKQHLIRPNPPLRPERPYINRPGSEISPFSHMRFRRFVDGANSVPNIPSLNNPSPNNNPSGWEINPNINRDQRGNTHGSVDITHHGENGDFHASWGQNVRGPDKHSETWGVGGSIKLPQN